MPAVIDSILSDILRLGNAPITEKTVPALKVLNAQVLDFADSLVAKGGSVDELSDFEEALDELTGITDNLDAACDAYDLADDEDSRDEALEMAGEALADLAHSLQEVDQLAQYVETTEQTVLSKWGGELARITSLPPKQARVALDALLDQTRTPKESSTLLSLAKDALLQATR